MLRTAALVLAGLLLTACSTTTGVRQYLDEQTAATITVSNEPWIFARERPELAVNARDYLSLYAVQINRTGERRSYLLVYAWSTIDRSDALPAAMALAIAADDRLTRLQSLGASPRSLGAGEPLIPRPTRQSRQWWFAVEGDALAHMATAKHVSVQLQNGGAPLEYVEWRTGRRGTKLIAESGK